MMKIIDSGRPYSVHEIQMDLVQSARQCYKSEKFFSQKIVSQTGSLVSKKNPF